MKKVLFCFVALYYVTLFTFGKPVKVFPFILKDYHLVEDSILVFSDTSNTLTINDVIQTEIQHKFIPLDSFGLSTTDKNTAYWIKFNMGSDVYKGPIFMERDKYAHILEYYIEQDDGNFTKQEAGFSKRYENWTFGEQGQAYFLIPVSKPSQTVYCRLISDYNTGLGQNTYTYMEFIQAKSELNFVSGLLYGVIGLMIFISFLLWIGLKESVYLYYFLYTLNFGLFTLIIQGNFLAFVAGRLDFSYDFFTIPYALMTIFLLLYMHSFIRGWQYEYGTQLVTVAIFFRLLLLLMPYLFGDVVYWRWVGFDIITLLPSLVMVYRAFIHKEALFLPLLGSVIVIFIAQFSHLFQIGLINSNRYVSFSIVVLFEIFIFLSALAYRFRQFKREKELALKEIIQVKENINRELETKVLERTQEIEKLNHKLVSQNIELEEENLTATKARITNEKLTYKEFQKIYPDELSCLKFIEQLKWRSGFRCKKCGNSKYSTDSVFSRKCSRCATTETVQNNTIFSRLRFPISKALYMVMISNELEKISSTDLSNELDLRLQTCWQFKSKILDKLKTINTKFLKEENWKSLILN